MGDNIFTTLMEIGAVLIVIIIIAIIIVPYLLDFIGATLPVIIGVSMLLLIPAIFITLYVIRGMTDKMEKGL